MCVALTCTEVHTCTCTYTCTCVCTCTCTLTGNKLGLGTNEKFYDIVKHRRQDTGYLIITGVYDIAMASQKSCSMYVIVKSKPHTRPV